MVYFDKKSIMSAQYNRLGSGLSVLLGAFMLSSCGSLTMLQTDKSFQNRIYAGAGVLVSQLEPDTSGVEGISIDESSGSGAGLLLGYDINDRLTVEGHVADLGDSTFSPDGSIGYQVAGLSGVVYGFNRRHDRQRRQGLSAFGRFGVGALNNEPEGVRFKRVNDVHFLAGVGLEYGFAQGLSARLELVGHDTDARHAQLSLLYRFGTGKKRSTGSVSTPALDNATTEERDNLQVSPFPDPEAGVIEKPVGDVTNEPLSGPAGKESTNPGLLQQNLPGEENANVQSLTSGLNDEDDDGVADEVDACPSTNTGIPVDSIGCDIFKGAIERIQFRINSADLTQGAVSALEQIVQIMRENPEIKVTIEAHTDNVGDAEENLQLSRRRALAVARFLVDEGISGLRLRPQAFGESQPRASNATAAGRAANRRVDFTVFK